MAIRTCKGELVVAADNQAGNRSDGCQGRIALVLAGGGARGAYEMGALSVLAPILEQRGEQVEIIVGTSIGDRKSVV